MTYLNFENHNRLIKVCEKHDLINFKQLIKSSKNFKNVNLNACFYVACTNESNKQNEFIDFFLSNKKFKKHIDFPYICSNLIRLNNLALFEKLSDLINMEESLLSKYLNLSIENNNIIFLNHLINKYKINNTLLNKSLVKACEIGNLDIVKYLFLKHNVDIHFNNDLPIRKAGSNNHIHIVKYLLEDNNLKEKANPSAMDDDLSICAIMQNNQKLIEYLYNHYGMIESDTVREYKEFKQKLAQTTHNST